MSWGIKFGQIQASTPTHNEPWQLRLCPICPGAPTLVVQPHAVTSIHIRAVRINCILHCRLDQRWQNPRKILIWKPAKMKIMQVPPKRSLKRIRMRWTKQHSGKLRIASFVYLLHNLSGSFWSQGIGTILDTSIIHSLFLGCLRLLSSWCSFVCLFICKRGLTIIQYCCATKLLNSLPWV